MSHSLESEPVPAGRNVETNARLLYFVGLGVVAASALYFAATASVEDPLHLQAGLAIYILATLPGLIWAKKGGRSLPLFEVFMLTTANSYAIPLLSGHEQLSHYQSGTVTTAAFAVILYQVVAIAAYLMLKGRPGRSAFFTREVLSHDIYRYIGYGLTLTTIYTIVATFTELIPDDLVGVLRAVFYGVGLVAVFVEARRWGLGTLSRYEKTFFIANFALQVVVQFSTLFLVGGISLTVLALVGYVAGSRKLPLVTVAVALLLTALLHNGKAAMRARFWLPDGTHIQPKVAQLPGFFSDWVAAGFTTHGDEESDLDMADKLVERTSLIHILCLVAARTPAPLPYLDGETYADIPGQFVPRFFWPEKPVGHVSTNTLSVYYGLQREEDTAKTTIGFGMLAEAYANFGMLGVGVLGCALGLFYKKIHTLAVDSPLVSYIGLFEIVLMAWSFQTEFPMSLWLSSMYQACVAVLGVPFIVRNFVG